MSMMRTAEEIKRDMEKAKKEPPITFTPEQKAKAREAGEMLKKNLAEEREKRRKQKEQPND